VANRTKADGNSISGREGRPEPAHEAGDGDRRSRKSSAERTRAALVAAGLKSFGRKGVEATSTREIAAEAGANIASIAYHFGGKEGLRLECAKYVAERLKEVAGTAIVGAAAEQRPGEILAKFEGGLSAMLNFLLLRPEAEDVAAFMLREVSAPSPALDLIYTELFGPVHTALCAMWGRATGAEPESEANKIAVFALIGQVIYFRIGLPLVMRRLGWSKIGEKEAEKIRTVLVSNLRSIAAAGKDTDR
jgi:AcrR family transcriptional regulator